MSSKLSAIKKEIAQLEENMPKLNDTLDNVLVIDNLPQVPEKKVEKLTRVLLQLVQQTGTVVQDGFQMPLADGKTKGFALVEFVNAKHAGNALKALDNYQLDQKHKFRVNVFSDLQRFASVPDEYVEPTEEEFAANLPPMARNNLKSYMCDPLGREQFAVKWGEETAVYLHDTMAESEPLHGKTSWTESYLAWSPKGTYMATFHAQGIAIWGGGDFDKLMRFKHIGVKLIDFSPSERYLVTYSDTDARNEAIIIWDVVTGKKMRAFPEPKEQLSWPVFKWSHDDKYFARQGKGAISAYETPSMKLLGKKSIKLGEVQSFQFAPDDYIISAYIPEAGNSPARVTLVELPSKREIRQKNLFNVSSCTMYWHPQGTYMAIKVDRHSKSRKSMSVVFEIFRMKAKDIPVETLDLKEDRVDAFAWEPQKHRFALVHGAKNAARPDVSFYSMHGKKLRCLKTLEKKNADNLFFSPRGDFVVIAGMGQMNGALEFWNLNDFELMATQEHFMCTNLAWDPTGRYVCTSVSYWRYQSDNGYKVWSFSGKLLVNKALDRFYQFLWRPRHPTLLSKEQLKAVKKGVSKRIPEYQLLDKKRELRSNKAAFMRRRRLLKSYAAVHDQRIAERKAQKAARTALQGYDSDELEGEWDTEEREVEVFLKESVETL